MSSQFEEIEAKYLEVKPAEMARKLESLGARKQFAGLYRRYVFDFPDLRLNSDNSWLRLRDEGDRVTLTFKQRTEVGVDGKDGGMREIEVVVDDFDRTSKVLLAIGMKPKFYEENRRTLYRLDGLDLCIDEWPLIPPYLEIEGASWAKVDAMAEKLGFSLKDKYVCATMQIYEKYGINEHDYRVLTFEKQEKTQLRQNSGSNPVPNQPKQAGYKI